MAKSHRRAAGAAKTASGADRRNRRELSTAQRPEGRMAPTERAGDEWQGGGRVVKGEEYISQAKLMGWGEEIRDEFDKGLKNFFLIYLFIGQNVHFCKML